MMKVPGTPPIPNFARKSDGAIEIRGFVSFFGRDNCIPLLGVGRRIDHLSDDKIRMLLLKILKRPSPQCRPGGLLVTENCCLDLLHSVHFVHAGDLAQAGDDLLQVFEIGDVEDDLHARLAVGGVGRDVADIALCIADNAGDVL
jgi:hypothetical protein